VDDLMLDDIDINFLENYQNLEIDNIYIEGDILNLDLNLNIDLPDILENQDDESFLKCVESFYSDFTSWTFTNLVKNIKSIQHWNTIKFTIDKIVLIPDYARLISSNARLFISPKVMSKHIRLAQNNLHVVTAIV
jgi:hypothetical protein